MPGTHKAEHVKLQVEDIQVAEDFYRNVMGLTEIESDNSTKYLGCGLDSNYDLAIEEGEPGVEHVAVRVSDVKKLDIYEERLTDDGFETVRTGGDEPGQEHGLRFRLPSGLAVELVTVEDKQYKHGESAAVEGRHIGAPLDINHYTFVSPDVKRDAQFLENYADFKISEIVDDWSGGAFLRRGDKHHDIAIFNLPGAPEDRASHHHTAFSLSSTDHMVQMIDAVCQAGVNLEYGIGRHHAGDNLYSYFQAPDGHRIELNPSMGELDDNTPTRRVDDVAEATVAWKDSFNPPESFLKGSGLVQ